MAIKLSDKYLSGFIAEHEYQNIQPAVSAAHKLIVDKSGAGNDFMVLDARGLTPDFSSLAKTLCAQYGADGLLALDEAKDADFRLHFYNADGSRGEMCGNGARCICRFAYDHGIAPQQMTVRTDAGLVQGWRLTESQYRVRLNLPSVLELHRRPDAAYVELGEPGIPHTLVELEDLSFDKMADLLPYALELRHDPVFPKGVNVSFYARLGADTVRVLTYERGVEDYTLACGTGCASIALVLHKRGLLPGGRLTAHNRGGKLTVTLEAVQDTVEAIYLEGPTEVLSIHEIKIPPSA